MPLRHPWHSGWLPIGFRRARRSAHRGQQLIVRAAFGDAAASTTGFMSARRTVESRWAMTIDVRPARLGERLLHTASDASPATPWPRRARPTREEPSSRREIVNRAAAHQMSGSPLPHHVSGRRASRPTTSASRARASAVHSRRRWRRGWPAADSIRSTHGIGARPDDHADGLLQRGEADVAYVNAVEAHAPRSMS